MHYEKGSVSGTGVSEKSTTNLQKPEFNLPNLAITGNSTFAVEIIADCDLTGFLTSGGDSDDNRSLLLFWWFSNTQITSVVGQSTFNQRE